MKTIKVLILSLLMVLSFVVFAYAAKEGRVPCIDNTDTQTAWYYADENGNYLVKEWKQIFNDWYYFGEDRKSKQNTWAEIDGKWYYFDAMSIMLHDTITPDGYTVGSDGVWIELEPKTTESIPTTEAVGPGIN